MASFDASELKDHYDKHRTDFSVANQSEYEKLADRFLSGPWRADLKQCKRKLGDLVRYDVATHEFGILSATGVIRSYFKPIPCASLPVGVPKVNCHNHLDNIAYYNEACLQW